MSKISSNEINEKYKLLEEKYSHLLEEYKNIEKVFNRYNINATEIAQDLNFSKQIITKKTSDVIWLMDLNGKSTFVSPSISSFTGYSEKEYLAQTIDERFTPASAKVAKESLFIKLIEYKNRIANDRTVNFIIELEYKCKDGSTKWGELDITPFFDEFGNFVAVNGVTRDITERIKNQIIFEQQEMQFTNMLERIPNMVFVHQDSKVVYANKLGREATNFKNGQLQDLNIFDKIHEDDKSLVRKMMDERENNQPIEDYIVRVIDVSNEWRNVVVRTANIQFNAKPSTLFILIDITERIKTENKIKESEEKFRILSELSPYAIMIYSDDLWVYANPAAEIISGYTQEELYQMRYWEFVHPIYRELVKENGERRMRGELIEKEYEFKILSKDGITKWVFLTGQKIKFQEQDSVLITVADITKQKTNEFELEEAKNRAEASDRLKTAFLNNISHEIRTPLNGIVNFGEMIMDQDLTPRERKYYHEILMESTTRLLTTVNDYMDISLLVSGNQIVKYTNFSLHEIFKQVLGIQNDKINHKSIVFSLFIDKNADKIVVNSDKDILIKILNQLISNAIKYTPNEGNIRINCSYPVDSLKIEIIDNGEGISKDVLEKIFSTFRQGDISSTRKHEGSGLGLAISKGFVDLLNGTIDIISTKSIGTTVTINIPCSKVITSISDKQMEILTTSTHHKSILIVEDEATNSLFLKLLLQKYGCEVDTVVNGKQAVDMVKTKSNFAVILMDIKMPIMDGFEATRQIKAIYPKIPIIATTAHAMSGDEDKALTAGCDDYITKPISKDILFEKLAKYGVI